MRWLLPHCIGRSLIPNFFAHHWQLQKIHCMGVSLVPAHSAHAGSQNQLITRELLCSWLPFPQQHPDCNGSCCFSFLTLGKSWSLRLLQMSGCFELSPCLDVSVLMLLLDWFQRCWSKAKICPVLHSAFPGNNPCPQLEKQPVGTEGRETF